uniref:hypothetical protein n=1 Tax=uncultured Bilophila sp. TaxID=529385 RepID=UPI0025EAFF6A|nr:hypothetical protein [uncultured Bilophila sp.]
MFDERTPVLQLPLPHPENRLEDDVLRVREAFGTVDTAVGDAVASVEAAIAEARTEFDATREEVSASMNSTVDAVRQALDAQRADIDGKIRLMRLNQLLGLDI